ncbi:MAG TPA: hypothetical protein VF089_05190, partial [Candidatus Binatia bacterium]
LLKKLVIAVVDPLFGSVAVTNSRSAMLMRTATRDFSVFSKMSHGKTEKRVCVEQDQNAAI